MATIVNDNPLVLILTNYGLTRIAEALSDNTVTLNLSKIKVGTGDNNEYYAPSEDQTELMGPIQNGSFYIIKKELLEDELTVSFLTVIPEGFGGYDIREIGLYETTENNEDKLFAICTQQPLVKPKALYNYLMSVDFYIFLKSANLANVYEQIVLNPDNMLISEEDLQELMTSMLFTQGNLSVQIGKNSHVIGLNRPTQLYEQIVSNRDALGYTAITGNFSTLGSFAGSSNIMGYWVFDYPGKNTADYSISDMSMNGYNFSIDRNINLLERDYYGLIPMLSFDYVTYYLTADTPFSLHDPVTDTDYSFTMMFTLAPIHTSGDRTLLAKSNYATKTHVFEVKELSTGAVQVKLFSDENNYVTFTTASNLINPEDTHALVICYNTEDLSMSGYLNGRYLNFNKTVTGNFTGISDGTTQLYAYSFAPYDLIYADSETTPTTLYNKDGSPYEGTLWNISEGTIIYNSAMVAEYDSNYDVSTDTLYAWTYNDGIYDYIIYTKTETLEADTVLYNGDYSVYTGSDYVIRPYGTSYIIQYANLYTMTYDSGLNIEPVTLYSYIVLTVVGSISFIFVRNGVILNFPYISYVNVPFFCKEGSRLSTAVRPNIFFRKMNNV